MNSKTTWWLFLAAVALFAFIALFESREPAKEAPGAAKVFPQLAAARVTGIEIQSSNLLVRADRTNEGWRLTRPFYPAQGTPIDAFVKTLLDLPKNAVISASEVAAQPGHLKDYGLEPPLAAITVYEGTNRYLLHLGKPTSFRDEIYAQAPGSGEVWVTTPAVWRAMPRGVNAWRSPMLLNLTGRPFDRMQIRSGPRLVEFERDETNLVWRIGKPTPARANNQRIIEMLQQLQTARVKEFVTDSPAADLEKYGLQTPQLELSFWQNTNRVTALEFGSSPTNDPGSVYVRRVATTNVVLAPRELLDGLNLDPKKYHDPRLISVEPSQLTMIQVKGPNPFTMARGTNGLWALTEPIPMAADATIAKAFLTNLLDMTIENFAKDVPTDADLKQFELAPPRISYSLFAMRTNAGVIANTKLMQVDFGAPTPEGMVYARRSDETPVYLSPDVSYLLPRQPWQLRDRQLFNFEPKHVLAITITAAGKSNRVEQTAQRWSLDEFRNEAMAETVFRLGKLQARNWVGKGSTQTQALGFRPDGVMLEIELVPGSATAPAVITFGKAGVRNNIYAATFLPGDAELTVFEFPGELFQSLLTNFGPP